MKSFQQQSRIQNDENTRIQTKSSTRSSSIDANIRREALSEITDSINIKQTKELNKHGNIKAFPKNTYQQFKKPKLNRIGGSIKVNEGLTSSSVNNDETDENDEFDDIDHFTNENRPPIDVQNHESSDDLLVRNHFDRLSDPQSHVRMQKESEHTSNQARDDEYEYNDYNETSVDEIIDLSKPMEPKWNKSIFNELQYVMKKFSRTTLDENDEDTFDVTMVAEYAPEIFNYMHELEHKLIPDPYYMDNQDELKWEMRSVLVDWVVQVHSRFNLLPETLFLTVNYIDRFLSKRKVSLSRFQLVGAVALFIAAKYEEINCPTVQEVAYMADNAYSVSDFLKAERFMIDVLEFDMGWPGPMSFLRRTSKADDYDYETRTLAKYFLEITIMDHRFVASQPSWLAAGSHYLSRKLLNKGTWTDAHVFYSGYTESQLKPLATVLLDNCRNAETNHKAIFEKYQERHYRRSSIFVQEYLEAIGHLSD